MESRRKGERQRQANEAARLAGAPQRGGDRRPFGYEEDKLTLRESEAALIRSAYTGIIEGTLTPTKIAYEWNRAGVRTSRGASWDTAKVAALLHRYRNAGMVTHTPESVMNGKKRRGETTRVLNTEGKPVPALWEAIVDEDTFLAATKILDARNGKVTRQHAPKWLASGLVTCASCDTPLSANTSARGTKYRCRTFQNADPVGKPNGKHVEIAAPILDEVLTRAAAQAVYYSPRSAVSDPDAEKVGTLRLRLADIRRAESDLLELVGTGAFKLADVASKKRDLTAEAEQIEEQVAGIAAGNAKAALIADVRSMLLGRTALTDAAAALAEIRERFLAMPLDQRRALTRGMLRAEVVAGGRGASRVRITHLVATSLNDEPYVGEEEAAV